MTEVSSADNKPAVSLVLRFITTFLGLVLFVYFVRQAGLREIAAGIRGIGWTFAIVVGLAGLRLAARAQAWRHCFTGVHRLTSNRAFGSVLAGDTLGNLTPLSVLVGEPAKALFASTREPVSRSLPALAVENLFYTLSAAFVIAGGAVALIVRLGLSDTLWMTGASVVIILIILISITHVLIWRRICLISGLATFMKRLGSLNGVVAHWTDRLCQLENHVHSLYPREPKRLICVAAWELTFHALAVLEIYIVLSLISEVSPSLLDAFIFESSNRFITAAFKVVPMRIGIDEAGTAAFAELLSFGTTTGVTLALIRKARMLVWMAVGMILLVHRGISLHGTIPEAESTDKANDRDTYSPWAPRGAVVVVMARSPDGPRPPKSRLASALPQAEDRRNLHVAFLTDIISMCQTLKGVTLKVAYTPDGATSGLLQAGVTPEQLMSQRGSDLGERERGIFEDLFGLGFSPVVLIGSDIPTLPAQRVSEAIERLQVHNKRVVLGPASDGGYYLIGLSASHDQRTVPDLFSSIRWSSNTTCADTSEAAERCGLQVSLLDCGRDIDDKSDLTWLRKQLANPTQALRAPATTALLKKLLGDNR